MALWLGKVKKTDAARQARRMRRESVFCARQPTSYSIPHLDDREIAEWYSTVDSLRAKREDLPKRSTALQRWRRHFQGIARRIW